MITVFFALVILVMLGALLRSPVGAHLVWGLFVLATLSWLAFALILAPASDWPLWQDIAMILGPPFVIGGALRFLETMIRADPYG